MNYFVKYAIAMAISAWVAQKTMEVLDDKKKS